jgi:hypothetical protein
MRIDTFVLLSLSLGSALSMNGSGHGPAFGLATPTNPKGGWSADLSVMSRLGQSGDGWMMRGGLGYGITRDLKVSVSAPVVFRREMLPAGRFAGFMPMGSDIEILSTWRFLRKNTGIGQRWESAVIGGMIAGGPQAAAGSNRIGALAGVVTGYASREHYIWGGATVQTRAADAPVNRRHVFYSGVYGYRPAAWRRDKGWDWRLFGELTGEQTRGSHRVYLGPSLLGVFKNYGISLGAQAPLTGGPERLRLSFNLAYFF